MARLVGVAKKEPDVDLKEALRLEKAAARKVAAAKVKADAARKEQEEARAKLEEIVAPLREKRGAHVGALKDATIQMNELRRASRQAREKMVGLVTKIKEIDKQAEDMGIPLALIGVRKRRADARKVMGKKPDVYVGRTTLKPEMIGEFDGVTIEGTYVVNGKEKQNVIVIACDGKKFTSWQITDGGVQAPVESTRLSEVTAKPGYLKTKDVAWSIVHALQLEDKFPALAYEIPATIGMVTHVDK